ncbi:hypothetical protein I7I53_00653 [Histoplasma capsulatum var. duboisii H88]|uniref:Uncharacterized protein n=1 Tax=Ajellomyces capsulatus (strain H88) TaxID=544711 RepID=A0A8A1LIU6_AJEC8|nr:hypothetical protein I7I53_00653 [Histoplasma capsulatum var. duboisii H88]
MSQLLGSDCVYQDRIGLGFPCYHSLPFAFCLWQRMDLEIVHIPETDDCFMIKNLCDTLHDSRTGFFRTVTLRRKSDGRMDCVSRIVLE